MVDLTPRWIDPWQTDALPWEAEGTPLQVGMQAYALLDMAFAPEHREALPVPTLSLFEGRYRGPDLTRLSPCLLPLPDLGADPQRSCWQKIMRLSSGKPMLSVLVSSSSAAEVAAHLTRQWDAVSAGGESWLLRLADSRVLPVLASVMHHDQRKRLVGGLRHWYYGTRQGRWAALEGQPAYPFNRDDQPWRLTAEQQKSLEQVAMADEICHYVMTHRQLRPQNLSPSRVYSCVVRVLERIYQRGVSDTSLMYRRAIIAIAAMDSEIAEPGHCDAETAAEDQP